MQFAHGGKWASIATLICSTKRPTVEMLLLATYCQEPPPPPSNQSFLTALHSTLVQRCKALTVITCQYVASVGQASPPQQPECFKLQCILRSCRDAKHSRSSRVNMSPALVRPPSPNNQSVLNCSAFYARAEMQSTQGHHVLICRQRWSGLLLWHAFVPPPRLQRLYLCVRTEVRVHVLSQPSCKRPTVELLLLEHTAHN